MEKSERIILETEPVGFSEPIFVVKIAASLKMEWEAGLHQTVMYPEDV